MTSITIEVRCEQEGASIGAATLERNGQPVSAAMLSRAFKPITPGYALKDAAGYPIIKDGEQAVCPRCSGPLMVSEPGTDPIYLLPGSFRIEAA